MTTKEFDEARWRCGMKAEFRGDIYDIASCNFEDRTVAICKDKNGDTIEWVQCESVTIVKS